MLNVGGKKVVGKWDITNRVAKFFYFAAAENSFFLWEATTQNIPPAAPSSFTLCRVSSLNQMTKRSFYFVDLWQLLIECCCPDFLLQSLNRISSISQFYTAGRPGGGDAGLCLSIWKWTLTISGHLIEVSICTWMLWETRHHPKHHPPTSTLTANLFTFQPKAISAGALCVVVRRWQRLFFIDGNVY